MCSGFAFGREGIRVMKQLVAIILVLGSFAVSSAESVNYSSSAVSIELPAKPVPQKKFESFFANKLNRGLVVADFSVRMLDAVSTRLGVTESCKCIVEDGTFLGTFSLKPVAQSNAGTVAYAAGVAAGITLVSSYLWSRGEHSKHHQKLYRFASRAYPAFDVQSELTTDISNWIVISKGRSH
jgi:hypothetical protein